MMHPSRQAYVEEAEDTDMGISLADLPTDRDYDLPSAAAGIAPERASALLSQFERKRRAAAIVVPTDDTRVRLRLRELGEPITLFGEGPGDRRDRLRELLTTLQERQESGEDVDMLRERAQTATPAAAEEEEEGDQQEEFYTEGSRELLDARKKIALYSLPRAKSRVAWQLEQSKIPLRTHIKHRKAVKEKLQGFDLYGSQIAADRPVSIARFSPNGQTVATGNWAGGIKLLSVPNLDEKFSVKGHSDRVSGLSWFPGATLSSSNVSESSLNFASGGGEGNVNLWSLDKKEPLATLSGHTERVCRVEFHPSGKYVASASYDTTWRLWDVETTTELLLQEGHSKEVYSVAFNSDGSLLASGGLDSYGRIWDLRTGRTVMVLQGHIREIYGIDWGVDGYRVLTGSGDGWVKCWDLRKVDCSGNIGAHKSVVSDVRWYKGCDSSHSYLPTTTTQNGDGDAMDTSENTSAEPRKAGTFFVSSGFDRNINVFSADDWSFVKSLSGHSDKVLSVDISPDAKWIASSSHDRTVKLWGIE
ncbi:pre-mRNA splicing factor, putative [Talaromyces stipitatus ATCC 10500]|uniref:Pre-mRNA splicing factor, putative n=1 Tax=Talaromyces stipitatus (strain ATCC 10500 / CBS 375.48 / QM 6759 / NRRL 1006) TaxID=441959 RepID=B8ME23_TALSN|nr:pre-mRNA splicing factor, putative [Talaromyces stipitatus ATCC 10500]EED16100.1 pre-mRNA splicing factor, putative [Talaromyces stipitatus ATCC 10500]